MDKQDIRGFVPNSRNTVRWVMAEAGVEEYKRLLNDYLIGFYDLLKDSIYDNPAYASYTEGNDYIRVLKVLRDDLEYRLDIYEEECREIISYVILALEERREINREISEQLVREGWAIEILGRVEEEFGIESIELRQALKFFGPRDRPITP